MTFDQWLQSPTRAEVVLCEVTPGLVLRAWTSAGGGHAAVYYASLERFAAESDAVTGQVYRKVSGFLINGSAQTARASLAALDAAASGYWWDEANGRLYAKAATLAALSSFTSTMALVTLYFSTGPVTLEQTAGDPTTAIPYRPWMSGPVPSSKREVEDWLFGQKLAESGSVEFAGGGAFWGRVIAPQGVWRWKNRTCRFLLGGSADGVALPLSEYESIATMKIEDAASTDDKATFTLKPLSSALSITVPVTPFFESDYPNLGEGVRGTRKWIGYGRTTMSPDLSDTSSHGVYTIADASVQDLYAVHAVRGIAKSNNARTLLTLTTDYIVDLTACTVTIVNPAYAWANYTLEVDVTGKTDGAGAPINTFGAIALDMLTEFVGVPLASIDVASFDQCDEDATAELSFWIKSERTISSIFSNSEPGMASLERSVLGTIQQTEAGLWRAWIWQPGYDASTAKTLIADDFAKFSPEPKFETVYYATRVYFNENMASGARSTQVATDNAVLYENDSRETCDVYTFLRDSSAALRLAQRYQLLLGAVSVEIDFEERYGKLAGAVAGDRVLVTYSPAMTPSGVYEATAMEIVRIEKQFSPSLRITGRLGDLRGIGAVVGHWKDSAAPDYSAATAAERAIAGFWSDGTGYIVPGDDATRNQSIWW